MLLFPLYYNIISLISLKITQKFHLLLDFAKNQGVFLYFKIRNSVWITKGSDNGDSDNQGSTVYIHNVSRDTHYVFLWELIFYLIHSIQTAENTPG